MLPEMGSAVCGEACIVIFAYILTCTSLLEGKSCFSAHALIFSVLTITDDVKIEYRTRVPIQLQQICEVYDLVLHIRKRTL